MDEAVPIALAFALGIVVWRRDNARTRLILGCCAVGIPGPIATIVSGEFRESWMFFLIDLGEAALGLAIGFFAAHWYWHLRGGAGRGRRCSAVN